MKIDEQWVCSSQHSRIRGGNGKTLLTWKAPSLQGGRNDACDGLSRRRTLEGRIKTPVWDEVNEAVEHKTNKCTNKCASESHEQSPGHDTGLIPGTMFPVLCMHHAASCV